MVKLEIRQIGGPEWVRYFIVQEGGLFWDGEAWTCERRRARFYADAQDAARTHNELQEAMFRDKPLREFTATMSVRVRAGEKYTIQQLRDYLERAVKLLLDQERFGTGPVPDSMVQLAVSWTDMVEVIQDDSGRET